MLANLLAALAADYAALLAARLLLALSAATFMPAASGYAARLGGAQRHGRALSMITDRLTLAIVVGVRLGVLVSEGFGRRATFLGMAGPAALSQLGILAWLPRQPPAAHRKDDLAPSLDVWSTHSSSAASKVVVSYLPTSPRAARTAGPDQVVLGRDAAPRRGFEGCHERSCPGHRRRRVYRQPRQ
jgi:predicted MFS family arabinose efflux permease